MLDTYCERAGNPGLWAEPFNLFTNLAFVIAALFAARRFLAMPGLGLRNGWDLILLIGLLGAIGIGSGLWHSVATRWAVLADVIPIMLFINLYLLSFGWRVLGLGVVGVGLLWGGYQAISYGLLTVVPVDALNGSVGYLPPLAFLFGFWLVLRWRRHPMTGSMLGAAGLFAASLTLRTIDKGVCGVAPIGTHFLWHVLNAVLLFLLLDGLMRFRGPASGGSRASAVASRS